MAGLIVSVTYTHNCDHSGPIAMSLWKMMALSWRATGSSCQQVSILRLGEVTRIPPGNREDASASSRMCVLERNQPGHWGCCAQVCNMPTHAACPTTWTPHATRNPFTCLADSGNWLICHKLRDIFSCVWLLLEVSIRLYDPKPSDKYRCHW